MALAAIIVAKATPTVIDANTASSLDEVQRNRGFRRNLVSPPNTPAQEHKLRLIDGFHCTLLILQN